MCACYARCPCSSIPSWVLLTLPQALVDSVGERRKVMNFKRLSITDYKVDIKRHCSEKDLSKALGDAGECSSFLMIQIYIVNT